MKKISKFGMPIIIALSIVLGMYVQSNLSNKRFNGQKNLNQLFSSSKLESAVKYIEQAYVDTVDAEELIDQTIPKILEELDPHSIYIPKKDFAAMNEPLEGNFDGIGVQFNIQKDTVSVVKVIAGGPSEKVGLRDGDRIVTVNDSVIAGIKINNRKVMTLLRGKKGTKVSVGIKRKGEEDLVPFTITRDAIPLYSVDVSYMINANTGYIKLTKFSRTTYKEFQQAIAKLKSQGMKKLIFDLRGNSGGYMDQAISIVDEFLPNGKLIVYTEGRSRPRSSYYSTGRNSCADLKLTVIIDEWSASASEIISGSIQDNDRGTIIGRRSFGKGLVQEPVMFADGSQMRLTTARYYTPSGRSIQKHYENGDKMDYYHDIEERYENGEFMEQDSISFPDSLKYHTSEGRVVYGGGGIMPDIFIPIDTSGTSEYMTKINRKGLEYQFSFEYTDNNRTKLASYKTTEQLVEYLNSQNLLESFITFAEKNGVPSDKKGIKASGNIIHTQVKALIARNIFDNDGFYPVIKDVDKTLLEGLRLMNE